MGWLTCYNTRSGVTVMVRRNDWLRLSSGWDGSFGKRPCPRVVSFSQILGYCAFSVTFEVVAFG